MTSIETVDLIVHELPSLNSRQINHNKNNIEIQANGGDDGDDSSELIVLGFDDMGPTTPTNDTGPHNNNSSNNSTRSGPNSMYDNDHNYNGHLPHQPSAKKQFQLEKRSKGFIKTYHSNQANCKPMNESNVYKNSDNTNNNRHQSHQQQYPPQRPSQTRSVIPNDPYSLLREYEYEARVKGLGHELTAQWYQQLGRILDYPVIILSAVSTVLAGISSQTASVACIKNEIVDNQNLGLTYSIMGLSLLTVILTSFNKTIQPKEKAHLHFSAKLEFDETHGH